MTADAMNAMGKPIPPQALSAALVALREMWPEVTTEHAMSLIGACADRLERDQPYEAFGVLRDDLDVTGSYRLVATLLAGVDLGGDE